MDSNTVLYNTFYFISNNLITRFYCNSIYLLLNTYLLYLKNYLQETAVNWEASIPSELPAAISTTSPVEPEIAAAEALELVASPLVQQEKPGLKCHQCGRSFSSKAHLRRHIATHTGDSCNS
jgi:hypothetical protein